MRWLTTLACVTAATALALPAVTLGSTAAQLAARVTSAVAHKPYPRAGALITVTFTVGEAGRPVGAGVPAGSLFQVQLTRKAGTPTPITPAIGQAGRYRATIRWPGGRIGSIRILAYLNTPSSIPTGSWLPVTTVHKNY